MEAKQIELEAKVLANKEAQPKREHEVKMLELKKLAEQEKRDVTSQEKMCPVHLYHRVYLADISCAKVNFLLPARNYKAQSGLAIKIESYIG